jgi:hypothetical protein
MTHIRLLRDHLTIGGQARKKGDILSVREVGEITAGMLVETKRAEPASEKAAEKAGVEG